MSLCPTDNSIASRAKRQETAKRESDRKTPTPAPRGKRTGAGAVATAGGNSDGHGLSITVPAGSFGALWDLDIPRLQPGRGQLCAVTVHAIVTIQYVGTCGLNKNDVTLQLGLVDDVSNTSDMGLVVANQKTKNTELDLGATSNYTEDWPLNIVGLLPAGANTQSFRVSARHDCVDTCGGGAFTVTVRGISYAVAVTGKNCEQA